MTIDLEDLQVIVLVDEETGEWFLESNVQLTDRQMQEVHQAVVEEFTCQQVIFVV